MSQDPRFKSPGDDHSHRTHRTESTVPGAPIDESISVLDPEMVQLTKKIAPSASSFAPLEVLGLGWVVVLSLVGGIVGGIWLDGRLGTGPVLTIVGLVLGLALAFVAARSLVRRATSR